LYFNEVPKFKIPENKATSPVLRIEIAVAEHSGIEWGRPETLITTPEGLQTIINTLWIFDEQNAIFDDITLGKLSLTLNLNIKAVSRYRFLSQLVLKPWEMINSLQELLVTGDIEKSMREQSRAVNP
jgi:hypothetical protein